MHFKKLLKIIPPKTSPAKAAGPEGTFCKPRREYLSELEAFFFEEEGGGVIYEHT